MMNKKEKTQAKKRTIIQLIVAAFSNGYLAGFFKHSIYTGNSKAVCVPGLNCYSCPGALGSCPIGALQSVLGGRKFNFSYYVVGIIVFFGSIFGRLICGFLCPFGLVQDLLHKIPVPKISVPKIVDKHLRWLKFFIAAVFVLILPIFLTNEFGMAPPYFCKWICPVGTLEGGLPLVTSIESLRANLGFLFNWKIGILCFVIILSIFIYRPFCKYICPLGAFYALFNKVSFYQMSVDFDTCIDCKLCEQKCEMNVSILKNINSLECIRCGKCVSVCPTGAISAGFKKVGS